MELFVLLIIGIATLIWLWKPIKHVLRFIKISANALGDFAEVGTTIVDREFQTGITSMITATVEQSGPTQEEHLAARDKHRQMQDDNQLLKDAMTKMLSDGNKSKNNKSKKTNKDGA